MRQQMDIGLPFLFAIFLWWFSTGAILYLDGLNRATFRYSFGATSLLAAAALAMLWWSRDATEVSSAYIAFTAALVIWGWNEMAFLMGYLTGTRRVPASERSHGIKRFSEATQTIITHEIAILISAFAIGVATWGSANVVGLWTFLTLWVMRLSTKINIFLGAPNITDEFLPANLTYLSSYFRRRPMNGFFPFAVTFSTLATAWLAHQLFLGQGTPFQVTSYSLLACLMALGVLEHWLLYVPLPTGRLWSWSLKDRPGLSGPVTATITSSESPPGNMKAHR